MTRSPVSVIVPRLRICSTQHGRFLVLCFIGARVENVGARAIARGFAQAGYCNTVRMLLDFVPEQC